MIGLYKIAGRATLLIQGQALYCSIKLHIQLSLIGIGFQRVGDFIFAGIARRISAGLNALAGQAVHPTRSKQPQRVVALPPVIANATLLADEQVIHLCRLQKVGHAEAGLASADDDDGIERRCCHDDAGSGALLFSRSRLFR